MNHRKLTQSLESYITLRSCERFKKTHIFCFISCVNHINCHQKDFGKMFHKYAFLKLDWSETDVNFDRNQSKSILNLIVTFFNQFLNKHANWIWCSEFVNKKLWSLAPVVTYIICCHDVSLVHTDLTTAYSFLILHYYCLFNFLWWLIIIIIKIIN